METERQDRLPFFDTDIYWRADGSLGHRVYRKHIHTNLYLSASSQHHPSNRRAVLSTLCTDLELSALKSACRRCWFSRGTFPDRKIKNLEVLSALNCCPNNSKPDNKPSSATLLPFIGPTFNRVSRELTQHNIKSVIRIYMVSSSRSKTIYNLKPYIYTEYPVSAASSILDRKVTVLTGRHQEDRKRPSNMTSDLLGYAGHKQSEASAPRLLGLCSIGNLGYLTPTLTHSSTCSGKFPAFYYILASFCTVLFNRFWGYVAVCVQLYCRWFTVLHLVVAVLHYMFRPTWLSSGVYDVLLLYSWRNLLRCICCLFLHVVILCAFPSVGWIKYDVLLFIITYATFLFCYSIVSPLLSFIFHTVYSSGFYSH
jgi:hypothetical protein